MAADLELNLHFDVPYSPLFNSNEDVWKSTNQNWINGGKSTPGKWKSTLKRPDIFPDRNKHPFSFTLRSKLSNQVLQRVLCPDARPDCLLTQWYPVKWLLLSRIPSWGCSQRLETTSLCLTLVTNSCWALPTLSTFGFCPDSGTDGLLPRRLRKSKTSSFSSGLVSHSLKVSRPNSCPDRNSLLKCL